MTTRDCEPAGNTVAVGLDTLLVLGRGIQVEGADPREAARVLMMLNRSQEVSGCDGGVDPVTQATLNRQFPFLRTISGPKCVTPVQLRRLEEKYGAVFSVSVVV